MDDSRLFGATADIHAATGALELGEHLRAARNRCGLSQLEVAGRLGRSQTAISRWERSDLEPTATELLLLCLVIRLDLVDLLRQAQVRHGIRHRSNRAWPMSIRLAIGVAIRRARERSGRAANDVAHAMALSGYRLWQIESGSDLTVEELKAVAGSDFIDLDVEDVLHRALALAGLEIFASTRGRAIPRHLASAFDLVAQDRVRQDFVDECPVGRAGVMIGERREDRQRGQAG